MVEVLKKICNSDDDDYEFIKNFLAYCITSETKEQKYLNVVGPSVSNDKSTIIKLMEEALSIYIFKAKKVYSQKHTARAINISHKSKTSVLFILRNLTRKKLMPISLKI